MEEVGTGLDILVADQEDQAEIVIDQFMKVRQEVARSVAGVDNSIAELNRRIAVLKGDLDRDRENPFMDPVDREDVYVALKNLRADLAAIERKKKDADKTMQAIENTSRKILTERYS